MNDEALRDRFGLAPWTDLDWDVGAEGLVGINLAADPELQRDLLAVMTAWKLGSSSIDYTRKTYLKDFAPHGDRDALIKGLWNSHTQAYDRFYHLIAPRSDAAIGIFAFDLTLVRARASFDLFLYSARRGMLIESSLVARSLLEQFAYAIAVWEADTDTLVFGTEPQAVIRELKKVYPKAGQAYGSLSRLGHFHPHEHYRFIGGGEQSTVVQRSWKFEVEALAWFFLVLYVKNQVFEHAYGASVHFRDAGLSGLRDGLITAFDELFDGVEFASVGQIRDMMV